jgi:hypothetical protein
MRVSELGSKFQFEPGSWLEGAMDVCVGSFSGFVRAFYIMAIWTYVNVIRPVCQQFGIQLSDGKRPKVPDGKIKVTAVGFGRTGTVRLCC